MAPALASHGGQKNFPPKIFNPNSPRTVFAAEGRRNQLCRFYVPLKAFLGAKSSFIQFLFYSYLMFVCADNNAMENLMTESVAFAAKKAR